MCVLNRQTLSGNPRSPKIAFQSVSLSLCQQTLEFGMTGRKKLWSLVSLALLTVLAVDLVIAYRWWAKRRVVTRPGFVVQTYEDGAGQEFQYAIFLPEGFDPSRKYPAVMFLNGRGENGSDGVRQLSNNFGVQIWEMKGKFPFVCVAPQCQDQWRYQSEENHRAIAILDDVIRRYNVDPDRIYLTGVSSGGTGVWSMAAEFPDRFAAVAPLCAGSVGLSAEQAAKVYADYQLPIWNFFNRGDEEALVRFNRELQITMLEAGLSPLVREYDQAGHDCWNSVYRTAELFQWLGEHSRKSNRHWETWTPFRPVLSQEAHFRDWERIGEWHLEEQVVSTVGHSKDESESSESAASNASPALLYRPGVRDFEFHFEWRCSEVVPIEVLLLPVDDETAALQMTIVSPDAGTGGIARSSGDWLDSPDPLSQRSWRTGDWNDVRIQRLGESLEVRLNGCRLHCVDVPNWNGPCRLALVANGGTPQQQMRFMRLRTPERVSAELEDGENVEASLERLQSVRLESRSAATEFEAASESDLLAEWRARIRPRQITWRTRDNGIHRFTRFQSEWFPQAGAPPIDEVQLTLTADELRFEGGGWQFTNQSYRTSPKTRAAEVPLRPGLLNSFTISLDDRFSTPAMASRPWQLFSMTSRDGRVDKLWQPRGFDYPRGQIAPAGWVTALDHSGFGDHFSEDQLSRTLQSLNVFAAVMGFSPAHPFLGLDQSNLYLRPEPVIADGRQFMVLEISTREDSPFQRPASVWLDLQAGYRPRRMIQPLERGGIQIDWRYGDADSHRDMATLAGWVINVYGRSVDSTRRISEAIISQSDSSIPTKVSPLEFPTGAWVVDDLRSEQYIVRSSGEPRQILAEEIHSQHPYALLRSTASGEATARLERWNRWKARLKAAWIPLSLAMLAFSVAAVASIRRRWFARRATSSPPQQ